MPNVQIPTSQSILSDNMNRPSRTWFIFFQDLWRAVRGNTQIKLGGRLNVNSTSVANSGSSSSTLISYDLPANSLANVGDTIEIKAWGSFASNSNNKTLSLYFGNTAISTISSAAINGGNWEFVTTIVIQNSSTQEIITQLLSTNTTVQSQSHYPLRRITTTEDITTSISINCQAQGVASNDIVQYALIINLYPYN